MAEYIENDYKILYNEKVIAGKDNLGNNLNDIIIAIAKGKTNKSAIQMYEKAGFIPYVCENEPRPSDVHLICRFEEVL